MKMTLKTHVPIATLVLVALYFIAGHVMAHPLGAPLKGVDVKLMGANGKVYTARTDSEGKFDFGDVPDGEYELFCSFDQCVKMAANTKGTVAQRAANPEFTIDLSNRGVTASLIRKTSIGKSGTATRSAQTNTFVMTSDWSDTAPSLQLTVGEKQPRPHLQGHVQVGGAS